MAHPSKNKTKLWRRTPKVSSQGEKKLHREGAGLQWSTKGRVSSNPLLVKLFMRAGIILPKESLT